MSSRVMYCGKSAATRDTCAHLKKAGYETACTKGYRTIIKQLNEFHPDLVIIDLTDLGETLTRRIIRAALHRTNSPFILLISDHQGQHEQLRCDQSLVRPFTARRLLETVRKLLASREGYVIQTGPLILDRRTRYARTPKGMVRLPPKQFQLLAYLMQHPGEVLSRRDLMAAVWKTDYMGDTRTLDVHIRWLRQRIEEDPSKPKFIRTVRGSGYCLDVDAPPKYGGEPILGE